ncbi:MAG: CBS domain-containing protein [Desulfobacteraceae bacterium]
MQGRNNKKKTEKIKADTIITSHINADFDAVASMLAAQKLYPDSIIIFPGSQEKNLRDFFISSMSYLFNMAAVDDIDFSQVKKLVLVDTRQKKRIRAISRLLKRKDIEIHIYDHHPDHPDDVKGVFEINRATGATVTILTEMIRAKNICISPEEATIMALGIYEDTGSFTYPSTTENDLREAGFLLSRGADLKTIASMVIKEIRPDQVTWLNDLLNEMTCHRINGVDVHISTISSPEYINDLAAIVQKVMKMENLDIFFAIVLMGNKINIIARSRTEEADVGKILSFMGGGGHPYAASAKVEEKTLAQAEQQLLKTLQQEIHAANIARELMSSPAITIEPHVTCKDASLIMTQYNVNALLIFEKKKNLLKGYITRQIIEKALYHKLAHLPVREYMTTEITAISPDADLPEIENKIMDGKQRILPVVEKNTVIGVLTRTDLLNFLVQQKKKGDPSDQGKTNANRLAKKRNILHFFKERLDKKTLALLKSLGKTADELHLSIFVVGGFVRDLLLYKRVDDLDIVVEGDGIAFARKFAALVKGRCNAYKKFGTAVIVMPDGYKIDVASARLEYYKFPAALPTVEMSSIKLDLFRRDFTINALAVRLNQDHFGTLIDFFGAQRDLKDKTIRTIHNLSFVEDPTRVFRAIKFANRYDFTIGKLTAGLIKNAVKIDFFKNLSGLRVFSELRQILEEENPIPAIITLKSYGLEKVIHPELYFDKQIFKLMEAAQKALSWHDLLYLDDNYQRWSVYFMIMTHKCTLKVAEEICCRLKFSPTQEKITLRQRLKAEERLDLLEKALPLKNSMLYSMLSVFGTEHILYMMASARKEKTKKAISHFYTQLKDVHIQIRGRDLVAMGLKPGPKFKSIMEEILNARLDGKVETREEELAFAENYMKSIQNIEKNNKSID